MVKKEGHNFDTSEIRFAITGYEDIFSGFDPRPLERRGLSDDFLFEAKRACAVKGDKVDFIFLVPKNKRDIKKEEKIKAKLDNHFEKHRGIFRSKMKKMVNLGIFLTILGVFLMMVATYLLFQYQHTRLLVSFFITLFEPAGWFIFWHGLDMAFFEPKQHISPDLEFYNKMADAKISFISV